MIVERRYAEAIDFCQLQLAASPRCVTLRLLLARALLAQRQPVAAVAQLQQCLRIDPACAAARALLDAAARPAGAASVSARQPLPPPPVERVGQPRRAHAEEARPAPRARVAHLAPAPRARPAQLAAAPQARVEPAVPRARVARVVQAPLPRIAPVAPAPRARVQQVVPAPPRRLEQMVPAAEARAQPVVPRIEPVVPTPPLRVDGAHPPQRIEQVVQEPLPPLERAALASPRAAELATPMRSRSVEPLRLHVVEPEPLPPIAEPAAALYDDDVVEVPTNVRRRPRPVGVAIDRPRARPRPSFAAANVDRPSSPPRAPRSWQRPLSIESRRPQPWSRMVLVVLALAGAGALFRLLPPVEPTPPPAATIAPLTPPPPARPAARIQRADVGQLPGDVWIHPLQGPSRRMPIRDSRLFGAERVGDRPSECRNGHCGVDLGGAYGEPVFAVHDGVVDRVQRADNDEHGGHYVRIAHRDGTIFTQYFHLSAIPRRLEEGAPVKAGEVVGRIGLSGVKRSEPHLHFTIAVQDPLHEDGRYLDPEPLVALWPVGVLTSPDEPARVTTSAPPGLARGFIRRRHHHARVADDAPAGD